ncbi:MAG TPA: single-stranded DNA-binding protein, partial [Bacteroidetes bacterium]|nr:single-stranded DNA-binding protein [Bacteroidota bacterium]
TRAWDDKEGNKRYTTEVHVDQLQMLERSQDTGSSMAPQSNAGMSANSSQGSPSAADSTVSNTPKVDDDLPF